MDKNIENYISKKLASLYGNKSDNMMKKILSIIDNKSINNISKKNLDQNDVYLITYADSIKRKGELTLNTLHKFSKQYLKGIISDIHLLPFYPYSSDDGFSVVDYKQVKEEFGNWKEIKDLSSDFSLMFDAVINHISSKSDWFVGYLNGDSKYQNYFIESDPNDNRLSLVKRPRALPLLTKFGEKNVWTTFSKDQIDLNIKEPEVFFEILDILLFYIENGAKTIRLDAIAYLWKELGTNCFSLTQTHDVLKVWRKIIAEIAPDVLLLSEVNDTHVNNISYFGNGLDEMNMVYEFTLSTMLVHTIQTESCDKLKNWSKDVTNIPKGGVFFNLLASHDGIGVVPARGILTENEITDMANRTLERGGKVSYKSTPDGDIPYELNINYYNAISETDDIEELKIKRFMCAQFTLLSFIGVPAIYIHSLLGSENDIEGMRKTGQNRSINREKLNADVLGNELSDSSSLRYKIFNHISELIRIRKKHEAFSPLSKQELIDIKDSRIFALCRESKSGEKILAFVNYSNDEVIFDLPYNIDGVDLISGEKYSSKNVFRLQPYEYKWIGV